MAAGKKTAARTSSESAVLEDLLAPGLSVVFCGTGAGNRSARIGAYYAGPGNRFWPTLYEIGLTPVRLAPGEWRRAPEFGIGLTDIAKRHVGPDSGLDPAGVDAEALKARIENCRPRILAFTSKKAASLFLGRPTGRIDYGPQRETIGRTMIHVLPSPSGAARGYWSLAPWRELAAAAG
ncbi:MAG: mismatch-specific DNA-glycosylase [Pseudomonadota bacterium]|nr:mismatch-specific DNA-glycosylase [Pseudomonadota bacterium]